MESYKLNFNGTGFRTERGRLAVWRPASNIVLGQLSGYGAETFADPILAALERALASGGRVCVFLDLELMDDYDSALRTRLNARFRAEERGISTLAVLARSRLLSMGVVVANLAFGDRVALHSECVTFEVDLDEALRASGVAGFPSSRSLRREREAVLAHA
jgi:hypothetical protein